MSYEFESKSYESLVVILAEVAGAEPAQHITFILKILYINPFRATRFMPIKNLPFFYIFLTMSHKLRQFLFCYQHLPRFWENFEGNTSSLVAWKLSRLIYLKIC